MSAIFMAPPLWPLMGMDLDPIRNYPGGQPVAPAPGGGRRTVEEVVGPPPNGPCRGFEPTLPRSGRLTDGLPRSGPPSTPVLGQSPRPSTDGLGDFGGLADGLLPW
jgi:hypothetical protein